MTAKEFLQNIITDELFNKLSTKEQGKINTACEHYDQAVADKNEDAIIEWQEDITDLVARFVSELEEKEEEMKKTALAETEATEAKAKAEQDVIDAANAKAEIERKRKTGGFLSFLQN